MTKAPTKTIILSAALVLLCTTTLFSAQILTGQPLVILDPGHDKNHPGLGTSAGLTEFTATLDLARHLKAFLSDTCRVYLTRPSNDAIADETAPALANRKKAALLISLHLHSNAATQPAIFYYDLPHAADTDTWQTRALRSQAAAKKLAETIATGIKTDQPGTRPMVLPGPIKPLEGINMPGILVEPFALSQIPESPDNRSLFLKTRARTLANAVLAFLADQGADG